MKKRTLAATSVGLLLGGLLQAPNVEAAPAWHFVGRVQEQSDYTGVGGYQVAQYGRLVHDGTRTVWQAASNGNRTAWSISFSVPSAPNPTRNRQRVCPVVRAPSHRPFSTWRSGA